MLLHKCARSISRYDTKIHIGKDFCCLIVSSEKKRRRSFLDRDRYRPAEGWENLKTSIIRRMSPFVETTWVCTWTNPFFLTWQEIVKVWDFDWMGFRKEWCEPRRRKTRRKLTWTPSNGGESRVLRSMVETVFHWRWQTFLEEHRGFVRGKSIGFLVNAGVEIIIQMGSNWKVGIKNWPCRFRLSSSLI